MGVRIEGLDDVMRMYDEAPAQMLKDVKTASRKAAKDVVRELKPQMPAEFRNLVGSSVRSLTDGTVSTMIGLFNRKKGDGDMEWFHAYWRNYGTLKHRDPSHTFMYGIKKHAKRRNNEGQPHENFYDGPASTNSERFLESFRMRLKELGYDI